MRALTLKHPFAYCIAHLNKRIENRTWRPWPSIVGRFIAIHGGGRPGGAKLEEARVDLDRLKALGLAPGSLVLPDAVIEGVVAVARVTGCVAASADPWFHGPYGWTLSDVTALPEAIPCRGAQGLWLVPDEVARLLPTPSPRPPEPEEPAMRNRSFRPEVSSLDLRAVPTPVPVLGGSLTGPVGAGGVLGGAAAIAAAVPVVVDTKLDLGDGIIVR